MLNLKNILQQIVSSQTELQKVLDEFLLLVNLFTFFFQTKDILLLKLE